MTVDVYSGAWWDEFSAFFSNEDLWDNGSRSLLLKYFAKFAVRDGGRRVLDVGCGPGIGTKRLNEMGFLAMGIDISPAMVESAKARQVEAYVSDCDPIPEEDETFDYVFCCTVVEWARNPYGMIREMARVIKPGGGVVIACLGPGNLPHEEALKRLRGETTNYNMLMPVELHRLLLDCGLKIRSMTGARSSHVSQETYAKLDWITKSYCSNLWIIGADKEGSLR